MKDWWCKQNEQTVTHVSDVNYNVCCIYKIIGDSFGYNIFVQNSQHTDLTRPAS